MAIDGRAERGRATRANLVSAATTLFAENGFEATTIEAVLAQAAISRGALYHHFHAKEDLFEAVFAEVEADVLGRVTAAAAQAHTPTKALMAGCKAWVRCAADPVVRRIVLVDAPGALGWKRWRELDEHYALGLIRMALVDVADEADLRESQVDGLAHVLLAALNELALMVAAAPDTPRAVRGAERTIDDLLERLLRP